MSKKMMSLGLTLIVTFLSIAPAFSNGHDEGLRDPHKHQAERKFKKKKFDLEKKIAEKTEKILVLERVAMDHGQEIYFAKEVDSIKNKMNIALAVSTIGMLGVVKSRNSVFVDQFTSKKLIYISSISGILVAFGYASYLVYRRYTGEIGAYVSVVEGKSEEQRQEIHTKLVKELLNDIAAYNVLNGEKN